MDTDLPAHIGDRTRRLHHHPGSLFPELRREFLVFPRHLIPSLPVKTLHRAPCPEGSGQARATHVLLPAWCLLRRADAAAVIGAALEAGAAGDGHRKIAGLVSRPAPTVRGWLRRFAGRAEA